MDWGKIVEQIPTVIEKVRTDYVFYKIGFRKFFYDKIKIMGGLFIMKKQHLDRCLFPHKDIEMPVGKKINFKKSPYVTYCL